MIRRLAALDALLADAHAIRYKAKDIFEVMKSLEFVTHFEPGLSP